MTTTSPSTAGVASPRERHGALDKWRAVRDRLDPDRRLNSDLARRLTLLG